MALPTTPEGIYDLLEADPAISAAIGLYSMENGSTVPALAVMHTGERMPEEWVPGGIEVVIRREATYASLPLLSGEVLLNPTWRVFVTQWALDDGGHQLQTVVERILALLPGAKAFDPSLPDGLTGLGQAVIRWTNPEAATPSP